MKKEVCIDEIVELSDEIISISIYLNRKGGPSYEKEIK